VSPVPSPSHHLHYWHRCGWLVRLLTLPERAVWASARWSWLLVVAWVAPRVQHHRRSPPRQPLGQPSPPPPLPNAATRAAQTAPQLATRRPSCGGSPSQSPSLLLRSRRLAQQLREQQLREQTARGRTRLHEEEQATAPRAYTQRFAVRWTIRVARAHRRLPARARRWVCCASDGGGVRSVRRTARALQQRPPRRRRHGRGGRGGGGDARAVRPT
jgi:hypothetical protein